MWSNTQWLAQTPIIPLTPTSWPQNCCSRCQVEWPHYKDPEGDKRPANAAQQDVPPAGFFSSFDDTRPSDPAQQDVPRSSSSPSSDNAWKPCKTPSVSGLQMWSLETLREGQFESRVWLQDHVPGQFWTLFIEYIQEMNIVHRKKIEEMNDRHEYGAGKTLMKWMSYDGAVRVWSGFPASEAHWTDEKTGEGYVDCGHHIYSMVARQTWPEVFMHRSVVKTDDIIEALFGYAWQCRRQKKTQTPFIVNFVDCLNNYCFAMWLQSMKPMD
jgi:hypothetical protein